MNDNRKAWTNEVLFNSIQGGSSHHFNSIDSRTQKLATSQPSNEKVILTSRKNWEAVQRKVFFY